jgi:four helix bundle protein
MAYGSLQELKCQLSLASRLGYLAEDQYRPIENTSDEAGRVLAGLIRALRPKT